MSSGSSLSLHDLDSAVSLLIQYEHVYTHNYDLVHMYVCAVTLLCLHIQSLLSQYYDTFMIELEGMQALLARPGESTFHLVK